MKIKFGFKDVDDRTTVKQLCDRYEVETIVFKYNNDKLYLSAQEILDQC